MIFSQKSGKRLDLFSTLMALKTCSGLIYNDSVQFQMEMWKISCRHPLFVEGTEPGYFTLLFHRGQQRNVQKVITHVHSYCFAHYTAPIDRCLAIRKMFLTTTIMRNCNISALRGRTWIITNSHCIVKGKISGGINGFFSLIKFV